MHEKLHFSGNFEYEQLAKVIIDKLKTQNEASEKVKKNIKKLQKQLNEAKQQEKKDRPQTKQM
jgi:hypothetical protein